MKALIVVDYQNDFVDGSLGFKRAQELEGAICTKIERYREEGHAVLFTMDTHGENYLETQEGRNLPIPHCMEGTEGWQLYGKVAKLQQADDPVFNKKSFGSYELAQYLKNHPFEEIELVGVVSNICVLSNAIIVKSVLPETKIVIDASCTASSDQALHEEALDVLANLQVEIINRN